MAQRFQCGLTHTYATAFVGRFFHRWLVEWLTRVVGWTLVDKSTAGTSYWDNVAGSGSTCSTISSYRIEVTSPSYVFSAASEGGFITLTGFSIANRNGIYKVRKYIGVVGNVYTLDLDIDFGVHSSGLPVGDSGLTWRFWLGTDAYCPTTTSDWAVVGGKGYTGAGLAIGTGVGDTLDAAGGTVTLTDVAANFQTSDVGKSITIAGATTPGHNGTFTIASRISATQITWANGAGGLPVSEAYTGTWSISYTQHVHFTAASWQQGFGAMRLSPFASWNAVSHSWSDSRYTSALSPANTPAASNSKIYIFAEGDIDHFTVVIRIVGGNYPNIQVWGAGELSPFSPTLDPRPGYIWAGNDTNTDDYDYVSYNFAPPIWGYFYTTGGSFVSGFRGLSYDDLTTATYYAMYPSVMPSSDVMVVNGLRCKVSTLPAHMLYKIPVILECRTANYMELRGTLRSVWACSSGLPILYAQGASGEYQILLRGMMVPWHNSRNAIPDMGMCCGAG